MTVKYAIFEERFLLWRNAAQSGISTSTC